jgi:hypothetical protein
VNSNQQHHGLPGLKTAAAVVIMLLEGYAYAPMLFAIVILLETLSGISPVVLSMTGEGGWSWTGIVFWLTVLPMGQLLLPETYYMLVMLLKYLVLGAPRLGPDGLPMMDSTWDKLRHFCMVCDLSRERKLSHHCVIECTCATFECATSFV